MAIQTLFLPAHLATEHVVIVHDDPAWLKKYFPAITAFVDVAKMVVVSTLESEAENAEDAAAVDMFLDEVFGLLKTVSCTLVC